MNLGRRDKLTIPPTYKNFRVVRTHGRMFGIPQAVDPDCVLHNANLFKHPAVISAATLDDLRQMIDAFDESSVTPVVVGQCDNYNLVRLGDKYYGVPQSAPGGDLHMPIDRARLAAIPVANMDELKAAIARTKDAAPVEYAGWLPIYVVSGNCGQHPQFGHTAAPPAGYRFTCSAPPLEPKASRWTLFNRWLGKTLGKIGRGIISVPRLFSAFVRPRRGVSIQARIRIFFAMIGLLLTLLRRGCKLTAILRFFHTRHLQSQLLVGDQRGLVFLTSMPFTFNQNPWVIEIEDPTTLFYPMIVNGQTCGLDIRQSPYYRIVKTLLESNQCKAILTHMRSTAQLVPKLFDSEAITNKVVYAPLGVKLPVRYQRHEPRPDEEPIELLFINSWCQAPDNFYVRGGLDILEAFATLRVRYPQIRLTMRTHLPLLDDHFHRIIESGWVRVMDRFFTSEEMAELHASSHIFLLPAARVHIVSLLQAMSYGLAVVASDGWGIEEYMEHDRNGLIVKGRYGKVSWADEEAGLLREDYEPMYTADPEVVEGIVEAVSRLVEDRQLRARLGRTARADVEANFNMANWNRGMKAAFDLASGHNEEPSASESILVRDCDERETELVATGSRN